MNDFSIKLNTDSQNIVINGDDTYKYIKEMLIKNGYVLIPWSDEIGTQFDIIFNYNIECPNWDLIQGGILANYLFVSILRYSSFAFNTQYSNITADYIIEKFNFPLLTNNTAQKLAELINGIIKEINQ